MISCSATVDIHILGIFQRVQLDLFNDCEGHYEMDPLVIIIDPMCVGQIWVLKVPTFCYIHASIPG